MKSGRKHEVHGQTEAKHSFEANITQIKFLTKVHIETSNDIRAPASKPH